MKIKKIEINWEDPINLKDIKQIDVDKDVGTGIYLWTSIMKENTYCVNYVGSAPVNGIFTRNKEHISKFKQYSLIDYETFCNESDLSKKEIDLKLYNSFPEDRDKQNALIELNITKSFLFYFPIWEEFVDLYTDIYFPNNKKSLNNFIRDIEGCVKLHFWRKGRTRRYLTFLESMRYNINPDNLEMRLKSDNISVIGINA